MSRMSLRLIVVATSLVIGMSLAKAETSPCKGLTEAACGANGACTWVKGYKTKKGKDMSAYCRKKPEKKADAATTAKKP